MVRLLISARSQSELMQPSNFLTKAVDTAIKEVTTIAKVQIDYAGLSYLDN